MEAFAPVQLRRQSIIEERNSLISSLISPPSPPRFVIRRDNDIDDGWGFWQPTSNQESRVRPLEGPERARILQNMAETRAKISKALSESQQKKRAAIFQQQSQVQTEIMSTGEKKELDLKAPSSKTRPAALMETISEEEDAPVIVSSGLASPARGLVGEVMEKDIYLGSANDTGLFP